MTQADMIQALVVMFHPDFSPTDWQTYLVRHRPCFYIADEPLLTHTAQIYLATVIGLVQMSSRPQRIYY